MSKISLRDVIVFAIIVVLKSCSSCTCITLQWNTDFSNPRSKKLFPFIQSNTVIFLPISLTSRIFKANFVSLRSSKHRDSTVYIKAGSGLFLSIEWPSLSYAFETATQLKWVNALVARQRKEWHLLKAYVAWRFMQYAFAAFSAR